MHPERVVRPGASRLRGVARDESSRRERGPGWNHAIAGGGMAAEALEGSPRDRLAGFGRTSRGRRGGVEGASRRRPGGDEEATRRRRGGVAEARSAPLPRIARFARCQWRLDGDVGSGGGVAQRFRAAVLYTAGPWFESRLPYQQAPGARDPSRASSAAAMRDQSEARISRTMRSRRPASSDACGASEVSQSAT
jgi:hypothetical protein